MVQKLLSALFFVFLSGQCLAVCLTFEQGMELNCSLNQDEKAILSCQNEHGPEYLAFIQDDNCSLARATELRGELSADELTRGLNSRIDEIDSILNHIDPNGKDQLVQIESGETVDYRIYKSIYNKAQLDLAFNKLLNLRDIFRDRSFKNIKMNSEGTAIFTNLVYSYLALKDRYYLALLNYYHYFSKDSVSEYLPKFAKLNLRLKKVIALEVLTKVYLKTKHISDNEIEFIHSEESKRRYEGTVLKQIKTAKDYSRLIQFLSVEEALVNRWGANRMAIKTIEESQVRSCGEGLVSFKNKNSNFISSSPAYQELVADDRYSQYIAKLDELVLLNSKEQILSEEKFEGLLKDIVYNDQILMSEFKEWNKWSDEEINNWILEQAKLLFEVIAEQWNEDVFSYTRAAVLSGDDLSIANISKQVTNQTFNRVRELIKEDLMYMFSYFGLKKASIDSLKDKVDQMTEIEYTAWHNKISENISTLYPELAENGLSYISRVDNQKAKKEETYQLAKSFMDAYLYRLKDEGKINIINPLIIRELQPTEPMELMAIKDSRIQYDFELMNLLAQNESFAKDYEQFKIDIQKNYMDKIATLDKQDFNPKTLMNLLKKIVLASGQDFYNKYPSNIFSDVKSIFSKFDLSKLTENDVDIDKIAKNIKKSTLELFSVSKDNTNIAKLYKYDILPKVKNTKTETNVCIDVKKNNWLTWSNIRLAMASSGTPAAAFFSFGSPRSKTSAVKSESVVGHDEIDELIKKSNIDFTKIANNSEQKVKEISSEMGVLRILKIFNIETPILSKENIPAEKVNFAPSKSDKLSLATYRLAKVRDTSLILEIPLTEKIAKTRDGKNGYRTYYVEETKSLFEKLALVYNQEKRSLKKSEAMKLIDQAFVNIIKGNSKKVETFCNAKISNYKNDDHFRTMFRTTSYLRANLKNSIETMDKCTTVTQLDESIVNDIKTKSEVWKEKVDTTLAWAGGVLFAATMVTMFLGTGGTAALPAAMFWLMVIDTAVFLPASIYSAKLGYNIHYIEQPKTLSFQRGLVDSQISKEFFSTNADYDEAKKEMKMGRYMTVGEAGLNALFVGLSVHWVKQSLGMRARSILTKAGIPSKGFGAPPRVKRVSESFIKTVKKHGFWNAVGKRALKSTNRILEYTPHFQPYTKDQLAEFVRVLIVKKGEELGIESTPWILKNDLESYFSALTNRYKEFKILDQDMKNLKLIYRDQSTMSAGEVFKNFSNTKLSFVPKSFIKALKANGAQGVKDYISRYDEILEKLMELRGKVLHDKSQKIKLIIDKLAEVKTLSIKDPDFYLKFRANSSLDYFQSTLTTAEIALMGEIASSGNRWYKLGSTTLGKFKPAFKDAKRIQTELQTLTFLNGKNFSANNPYITNRLSSDEKDLQYFYEDMIVQDGGVSINNDIKNLRDNIEGLLPSH